MSNKPLFQHRHFCKIAEIIASIPHEPSRMIVADHFAVSLRSSNAQFSEDRFRAAALGNPSGRDKVRS